MYRAKALGKALMKSSIRDARPGYKLLQVERTYAVPSNAKSFLSLPAIMSRRRECGLRGAGEMASPAGGLSLSNSFRLRRDRNDHPDRRICVRKLAGRCVGAGDITVRPAPLYQCEPPVKQFSRRIWLRRWLSILDETKLNAKHLKLEITKAP